MVGVSCLALDFLCLRLVQLAPSNYKSHKSSFKYIDISCIHVYHFFPKKKQLYLLHSYSKIYFKNVLQIGSVRDAYKYLIL